MASTILSESDACEWRDRLAINMNIMEFSDIYRSAQAFSNCNLSVNSIAHSIFNLRHLLKKWVLVSDGAGDGPTAAKTASTSGGQVTPLAEDATTSARGVTASLRGLTTSAGGAVTSAGGETTLDGGETTSAGSETMSVGDVTLAGATTSVGVKLGGSAIQADKKDKVYTNSQEFQDALHRLNSALSERNLAALDAIQNQKSNLSEDQILVGLGIHLIQKLSGHAALTSSRRSAIACPCRCTEKLKSCRTMYIGSNQTMHGELDLVAQGSKGGEIGVKVFVQNGEVSDDQEENTTGKLERSNSGGERVNIEFKEDTAKSWTSYRNQITGQAVTFAFLEYNRHRDLGAYIPSLYLDSERIWFVIYNPKEDHLIMSEKRLKFNKLKGWFNGVFLLWLILHHRLFFKESFAIYDAEKYRSKFRSLVNTEPYEKLDHYEVYVSASDWGWAGPVDTDECFGLKRKRSDSESS